MQEELAKYYDSKIVTWTSDQAIAVKQFGTLSDAEIKSVIDQTNRSIIEHKLQPFVINFESIQVHPSWNKPRFVRFIIIQKI